MPSSIFLSNVAKDAILSFVFLLFLYGSTHNQFTHPTPKPKPGNWSIQKMQHPLFFGFAGHNYLALRDPLGDIVYELHGLATDTGTGEWKYIGNTGKETLKVWEFEGPRDYFAEKHYPGVILAEGNKEDMMQLWEEARGCKDKINQKTYAYPAYGFSLKSQTTNSNSVAFTLIKCINKSARYMGIIVPGEGRNLLGN